MTWSDRNEREACCDGLGPILDHESLCRILIKRTSEPLFYEWLGRKELFPTHEFSNVCGAQDGMSIDRATDLSDLEITARSHARAAVGKNRVSNGGIEAIARKIRSIKRFDAEGAAFKIYDDPLEENQAHAVIRGVAEIPEEDRSLIIDELKIQFVTPRGDFTTLPG